MGEQMRIIPELGVYWRDRDTIQVGLDPRVGAIIEGLTHQEQEFVSLLTQERTVTELHPVAEAYGMSSSRLAEILGMLARAGLLEGTDAPAPTRHNATNDRTVWRVHIDNLDALGTAIALKLAENGISHLSFADGAAVSRLDHPLMWPRWDGLSRTRAMTTLLRQYSPHVDVTGDGTPDVAVVTGSRLILASATERWMEEDIPHLLAWTEDIDTCVGPLVEPHRSVCASCLHESRLEQDDAWGFLAAQARAGSPPHLSSDTRDLSASIAARTILSLLDGHGNPLHDSQWRVPPLPTFPFLASHPPHPRCGCTSYAAMVNALTSALPAPAGQRSQLRAVEGPELSVDDI